MSKVLVLGDLIEDVYKFVDVTRVSPEAPCLVGLAHGDDARRLGGAGNVALNIRSLTDDLLLAGAGTQEYEDLLTQNKIPCKLLRTDLQSTKIRFIDTKTRIQLFRYDIEKETPPITSRYHPFVHELPWRGVEVAVIVDYLKGMVKGQTPAAKVNIVSTKNPEPHLVAPLRTNGEVNILVLNYGEWSKVKQFQRYSYVVRTEGADGISIMDSYGVKILHHTPGRPVDVFDVTGAGDTVVAVIAWFLAENGFSEENLKRAARLANIAGSIVVTRHGTATITREEILSVASSL